ncbi:Sodium:neurotransmitter symporter family protein [Besnoitia besnoiti]|uniref:Sodium:neurotransmitter symporter family protein n=1 Tax=Besnoitia besnoiti TaxID=94643 RepID=A0A2A9MH76_BESBE|nr:Sodium:neurotransmitter symporter family protein [Besnoitia besnoiti]PFH37259.1 Sodium:neurotransmitter symporter family protein [Besnoitia besnoiti]
MAFLFSSPFSQGSCVAEDACSTQAESSANRPNSTVGPSAASISAPLCVAPPPRPNALHHHVNFLVQASVSSVLAFPALSRSLFKDAVAISAKHSLRLHTDLKWGACRNCFTPYVPGLTCCVRLESPSAPLAASLSPSSLAPCSDASTASREGSGTCAASPASSASYSLASPRTAHRSKQEIRSSSPPSQSDVETPPSVSGRGEETAQLHESLQRPAVTGAEVGRAATPRPEAGLATSPRRLRRRRIRRSGTCRRLQRRREREGDDLRIPSLDSSVAAPPASSFPPSSSAAACSPPSAACLASSPRGPAPESPSSAAGPPSAPASSTSGPSSSLSSTSSVPAVAGGGSSASAPAHGAASGAADETQRRKKRKAVFVRDPKPCSASFLRVTCLTCGVAGRRATIPQRPLEEEDSIR